MNALKLNHILNLKSKCFFYLQLNKTISSGSNHQTVSLAFDSFDKYFSDKALIIAHGIFGSKSNWKSLGQELNEKTRYKVYTVDLRNHADSKPYTDSMTYVDMAHDLNNFIQNTVLKEQAIKEVALLGHSMGGKAGMALSLIYPKAIKKLIVGDISPNTSPTIENENIETCIKTMKQVDFSHVTTILDARKLAEKALLEVPSLKADASMRAFIVTRVTKRDQKYTWNFNVDSISNHVEDINEFPKFAPNQKYENLTLFLCGTKSDFITDKDIPDIERYFPRYKLVKIPNASHIIHLDNPKDTINAIDQYLNDNHD